MFPSEVQMKVLREELEHQVEQHRLAQIARGDQPSLWSRLRERLSTPAPETQPTAVPRKKRATA